ncbi:TPR repeat-containing protein [Solidesulfovibrio fructosivorans JJ]]|uniref:TPR repeat-containing protein n=1 Tax=Solidesulfovibrio fructosivorans JJ] TaxID=596151 RepID=E1JTL2_SOLFR|nr:tetratricopeptide repeat protein [Solidesulfovibrio fructosivorans]EFL52472.1 TPR repeat-containing protein [Solidesulfovibrio fructosivorans JJ]]
MDRFSVRGMSLVLALWFLAACFGGCARKALPPAPVAPLPSAAERLAAGKKAFAAGKFQAALPDLAAAAGQAPDLAEAHFYLGLCAAKTGDAKRAATELSRAAAADAADPRPLEALGILQYEAGRRQAALASLDAAIGRGSKSAQVYYYRANLAMATGDCRHALAAYRRAMLLDPSFAAAGVEYQSARMACARAETPPKVPAPFTPKPLPRSKPASDHKAVPASRPAPAAKSVPATSAVAHPAPAEPLSPTPTTGRPTTENPSPATP